MSSMVPKTTGTDGWRAQPARVRTYPRAELVKDWFECYETVSGITEALPRNPACNIAMPGHLLSAWCCHEREWQIWTPGYLCWRWQPSSLVPQRISSSVFFRALPPV